MFLIKHPDSQHIKGVIIYNPVIKKNSFDSSLFPYQYHMYISDSELLF